MKSIAIIVDSEATFKRKLQKEFKLFKHIASKCDELIIMHKSAREVSIKAGGLEVRYIAVYIPADALKTEPVDEVTCAMKITELNYDWIAQIREILKTKIC